MQNKLLNRQISDAKENFNYFFMIMIIKIIRTLLLLSTVLIANLIFDILLVNIITLMYTIYTLFNIYKTIDTYRYILNDIKNTFDYETFYYVIDLRLFQKNLFGKVVKYGK